MLKIQKTLVNTAEERLIFDDIIPTEYGFMTELDGKKGSLDEDGIQIIEPLNDDIRWCEEYQYFVVERNNKYKILDANGEQIGNCQFDYVGLCFEGMIEIGNNGKKGFISVDGKYFIDAEYDNVERFFNGKAKVWRDSKCGYINKTGFQIISVEYDFISSFYEGVAITGKNCRYGYITEDGVELLPAEYEEIAEFEYGFGFAKKGEEFVCVARNGKKIFKIDGDDIFIDINEKINKMSNYYGLEGNCKELEESGLVLVETEILFICFLSMKKPWELCRIEK